MASTKAAFALDRYLKKFAQEDLKTRMVFISAMFYFRERIEIPRLYL
jgi:hypothetical protein